MHPKSTREAALRPRQEVPDEDWFCKDCVGSGKDRAPKPAKVGDGPCRDAPLQHGRLGPERGIRINPEQPGNRRRRSQSTRRLRFASSSTRRTSRRWWTLWSVSAESARRQRRSQRAQRGSGGGPALACAQLAMSEKYEALEREVTAALPAVAATPKRKPKPKAKAAAAKEPRAEKAKVAEASDAAPPAAAATLPPMDMNQLPIPLQPAA